MSKITHRGTPTIEWNRGKLCSFHKTIILWHPQNNILAAYEKQYSSSIHISSLAASANQYSSSIHKIIFLQHPQNYNFASSAKQYSCSIHKQNFSSTRKAIFLYYPENNNCAASAKQYSCSIRKAVFKKYPQTVV